MDTAVEMTAKQDRTAYMREWHKAHPLAPAEKEQAAARTRAWTAANRERKAASDRAYREANREEIAAKRAAQYAANAEHVCARVREFSEANPHVAAASQARFRTGNPKVVPAWANEDAINAIYREARRLGTHVDHIIPLRSPLVSGLHTEGNLQLLTAQANSEKHNKFDPDGWWPEGVPRPEAQRCPA